MRSFQRSFTFVIFLVLLFSVCALPGNVSAKCPVRIPDSLLTLYLKSDLVVIASIKSEKFLKTTDETEHGSYLEIEKNLQISDSLKGLDLNSAAFSITEYRPKNPENIADFSEEIETYPSVGDKALFFLIKNTENDFYQPADYGSAIKELKDDDLSVYIKRIKELKQIVATRKNQPAKLTEWLVRLVEEPATRTEGTIDLQASFRALEYQQEENAEEEVFVKQPILLDENFRAGSTSEIAELLTDSQKERLSNALLDSINNHLLKLNDAENAEEITPDYDFINLIGHWDKTYLSMSSFALLQNTADSNHRRVSYLLRVITYFLNDNELYEISAEYEDALSQDENAVIEFSDEKVFTSETALEVENFTENRAVVKVPEETVEENEKGNSDESIKKPANETTYKQYREKLRLKFNRQYGIVISQTSASR